MKKISKSFPLSLLLISLGLSIMAFYPSVNWEETDLQGAWKLQKKNGEKVDGTWVRMVAGDHFLYSHFDEKSKKFMGTEGGVFKYEEGKVVETLEFNTWDNEKVGNEYTFEVEVKGNKLTMEGILDGEKVVEIWKRMDDGTEQPLAGAWRIRERKVNDEMRTMKRGPRKTIKLLTGERFQWTAFNTETKKFSGCGGGTYSAKDGKYTETIEYFSRDSSRVGMSLSFDFEKKGDDWLHSGFSSKGKPIYEIWALE